MVVHGTKRWGTSNYCTYSIYGTFSSSNSGQDLENEMIDYSIKEMNNTKNCPVTELKDVFTFYKDLSFVGHPAIVGTTEFVVERDMLGYWFGFINQDTINKLFEQEKEK